MGNYTEQMENELFLQFYGFDDYDEDYSVLVNMLNQESVFRSFGEGLLFYLQSKDSSLNKETVIKYIEEKCAENNVPKNEVASLNTLKNWFRNDLRPKKSEESRKSIFALAFALKFNVKETAEMFHKVYLDRAFDFRNEKEIIYYYCLANDKSWNDAQLLINEVEMISGKGLDKTVYTSQIEDEINNIKTNDELIEYIAEHKHNFEKKNVSAFKNMRKLMERAQLTAKIEAEKEEYRGAFSGSDRNSSSFLYEVITGQSVSGEKGTKTLFKNSRLPKEIKNRFPEAGTFSKKEPTYEELRKLIILLFSYSYWYKVQYDSEYAEDNDIEDYISEIDSYLEDSGFSTMYYGNPYDWMFMYCSVSERPLDVFRGLLAIVLEE